MRAHAVDVLVAHDLDRLSREQTTRRICSEADRYDVRFAS